MTTTLGRCRAPALALASVLLGSAGPAAAIVGGTPTTDFRVVGAGVQFTDNWVLTARHVGYTVGATWGNGYGSATVAARYDLPGPGFPQNDLTLLRLATPIDIAPLALAATLLAPGTLPAPIAATIATAANQAPRGYAATQLQAVWDSVDPDDSGPLTSVPVDWLITYSADFGPPYVQSGDSGGGLFLGHVTDATTPLLGITSALIEDENDPTVHASAFVQLAAYRSWIDATMNTDLADDQMAWWVSSVPEPSTWTLWLGGLAALTVLRPRWRSRSSAGAAPTGAAPAP